MPENVEVIITPPPSVTVEVTTTDPPVVQLTVSETPQVVTQYVIGPQGPAGTAGGLGTIPDVNTTAKIDKSLLYYDAASGQFKADASITTTQLTDGGNY